MNPEPNTAQSIVDGQLAELQITSAEVTATDYKEAHALKIAALATEADALPDITDKASLQANQDFLTKATRARTGIDKWRKAWKEPWKKIAEQVDTYLGTNRESGLQAKIAAIEDKVEAKKKAYLDEQAKAQREAERLLEERYNERVGKLMAIGMAFEPNGNLTIRHGEEVATATKEQIRFATDEQMAGAVQRAEIIAERIADAVEAERQAKDAEERDRQEEANRLAIQKRVQEAEAAKLKGEREAFEKEKAEMRRVKAQERAGELRALGVVAMRDEMNREVNMDELGDLDAESWADLKAFAIKGKEEFEAAKVKKEAEARDNQPLDNVFETLADITRPEDIEAVHILPNEAMDRRHSQPLQEGSAVVGAQPDLESGVVTTDADPLDAEATAWVVEPFDTPEEKAQWENSDWFLRCKLSYIAGYKAAQNSK